MSESITTTQKPWDRPAWLPETYAAAYIKAIREKKVIIRHNKWRPDPKLNFENQSFAGFMGSGQFGSVLDVLNTDTNKHYALKLQFELEKFEPSDLRPKHSLEPARTASSEATKSSSQSVERRSLRAKRHQETRAYLLWIRTGHPNICNLEAFVQYRPEYSRGKGDTAMGLYFEHCELGSLDALSRGFRDNDSKPPELFIWHVFHELASGLAFLHNQHPDYNTLKEHQGREPIFQDDMFGRNIFLKWGPDREGAYPHLKIGDFGVSYTVPHGGHIPDPEYDEPLSTDEDWASTAARIKKEVWYLGALIYELSHSGFVLDSMRHYSIAKQHELYKEIEPIESHLSLHLDTLTRGLLDPDPAQKRLSGELYLSLKTAYEERAGLMYRELPDWIGEQAIKHKFDEKRWKELNEEEGAIERELAAFDRWRQVDALAQSLFEEYLDTENRLTDEEFEAMEKQFYEQAAREVDANLAEGGDIVQTSCDNYGL
ncbi:hypothetical protein EYC80_007008 [Monilinia laxa]|uniref:non-specific serine/threonine protein kinase n=1 Tax=Monilinia laxa TaxID=61186 RepID=A0A5N6K035_MONLA|nr:hypothetical protein EYC80_007008 [Monilinia laxa]